MVDTSSKSLRHTRSLQCQRSLIVAGDGTTPSRHLLNYPRLRCLLLLVGPSESKAEPEVWGTSGWVQSYRLGTANYYAENRE